MKIQLAKSAGFCFGVRRAIDIAYKTLAENKNVHMLGDIVHNEEVTRKLERAGLKKIEKINCGKNKVFLIRAHGVGLNIINQARKVGYKIVDATCPKVKEIHKIAQSAECRGYEIIVIGDKEHDEVRGIIGQLRKRAIIIDNIKNIPWAKIKKIRKACVVVQSTQNWEEIRKVIAALKQRIKELKFFNTICHTTRLKQQEIKSMPLKNDLMVIIGSRTSANTRRLYEISKSLNKKTYWVQSKRDIRAEWFKGIETVGITAGASTPEETTQEVIACIKKLA